MKAFTVFQPYGFAIVAGLKGNETRPRRTTIRGRVAVHAGAAGFDAAMKGRTQEDRDRIAALQHESPFIDNVLFRGAVLGTVEIADCVPVEEITATLTERERLLGDYSPGRWAWILENPVMFDVPIPAKGKQGWWNWESHDYQIGYSNGFKDCGIILQPHNENGHTPAMFQSIRNLYERSIYAIHPTDFQQGYGDGFDARAERRETEEPK